MTRMRRAPRRPYLRSITLEPDGGVVMVGSADLSVTAARVDAAGRTLWSVVHQVGKPYVSAGGFMEIGSFGGPSLLQPDGKVVIAGLATTGTGRRNPLLLRLDGNDGSLDRTFGDGGIGHRPARAGDGGLRRRRDL